MQVSPQPASIKNLELQERWASIIGGGALIGFALSKRTPAMSVLAALGADLVYFGVNGHSLLCSKLFARNGGSRGASASIGYKEGIRVDNSIVIEQPRERVYAFWRKLENLPRVMRHLQKVTDIGGDRSHWVAQGPGGKMVEWDAEIINDEPNELIGWRSLPGSEISSAGSVHFNSARGGSGTRLTVELQYDPPGGVVGATVAKLLGADPADQIPEDLKRFKQWIENTNTLSSDL